MKRVLSVWAVMVAGSGALAQSSVFDGRWGLQDMPECLSEDGMSSLCPILTIQNGAFLGEESVCAMTLLAVVPGMESAAVYDFSCRGEGDTWSFRSLMHRDNQNRLTLLDDFGLVVYLPAVEPGPAPVK